VNVPTNNKININALGIPKINIIPQSLLVLFCSNKIGITINIIIPRAGISGNLVNITINAQTDNIRNSGIKKLLSNFINHHLQNIEISPLATLSPAITESIPSPTPSLTQPTTNVY